MTNPDIEPMDFEAFTLSRKKYASAIWKSLSQKEKRKQYDNYLSTFSSSSLKKLNSPKAPAAKIIDPKKDLSFADFSALQNQLGPYWGRLSVNEKNQKYRDALERLTSSNSLREGADEITSDVAEMPEAINLYEAAKIANKVIVNFDYNEISSLSDFFKTSEEAIEATKLSHDNLRPDYTKEVLDWYESTTQLAVDMVSQQSVNKSVDKSMQLGLTAVLKKLGWDKNSLTASEAQPSAENTTGSSAQIKKKRSWSEIKKDSH